MSDVPLTAHRRTAAAAVLTAAVLAGFAGCVQGSEPVTPPGYAPGLGAPRATPAPRQPGGSPAQRPPAAPLLRTSEQFDRAPCALLPPDDLLAELIEPYLVLSGQTLTLGGRPSPAAGRSADESDGIGCGFGFVGEATDTADAFHSVVIRVTRWHTSGPRRMAECKAAAATAAASPPARYRTLDMRDEACLGPGAVLQIRVARLHYSVAVVVDPHLRDTGDEDVLLAPMALAAARVAAARLPDR